jgi:glycerol-3-phosphate dehydrogenase
MAYRLALAANDLVSVSRNRGIDARRAIPSGRLVSRDECLKLFPGFLPGHELTGGALWHDAQLRHPERLTLSFLRSAVRRGAAAANYVRVDGFRVVNRTIEGALVTDSVSGRSFQIRSRAVLVAAGSSTDRLVASATGLAPQARAQTHALGVNVLLRRSLAKIAVGVQARSSRELDPVIGGKRFLFLTPQGAGTLLGTWYSLATGSDPAAEAARGAKILVEELGEACPTLGLTINDVVRHYWGWLPLKAGQEPGRADALAERPRILDHGGTSGVRYLFSLEGVKYTTARAVAEEAVTRVFTGVGWKSPPCRTSEVRLDLEPEPDALNAVREEMAIKLSDIVFRRTSLGDLPGPERSAVATAARVAGDELGWDAARQEIEVASVMRQAGVTALPAEVTG